MKNTLKTDVAIIGAGPTGLALACQLIRQGVDFLILDKNKGTTAFSKAIGVQARTLEIYEQINLADRLIEQGTPATKVRMLEGGEAKAEVELGRLGQGVSPYPFLLIVDQGRHEHLLYEFIKSHGKDILWQTSLLEFSQNESGVTGTIEHEGGEKQEFQAKYLVACDGAKSSIRTGLGQTFGGSTFERLFYVADVELNWEFPHDMLTACLGKDRSTAFFPMLGDNRYRIVGVFPEDCDKKEGEILYEEVEKQIIEDTELTLDITKVNWFSTYKVHSRRVNKFSEGRCFLAGDAAHIHSPAGAQGMNTGIQDGYNLAWKLALVLRGEADEKLLQTYNEERIVVATRLLETTDRMFDLLVNPAWLLSFVRRNIFPHVANFVLSIESASKFIFPLISQTGINYRERSLSKQNGEEFEVKSGDRMPYFLNDGKSIYDSLRKQNFHLLTFAREQSNDIANEIESSYAGLVDYHALPLTPQVAEIFGTDAPFSVLLRPDNYIGFISTGNASSGLTDYFENVIGRSSERKVMHSAN